MNRKALVIVGARPQFIKCAALSPVLRKKFEEVIVHTGQHYDYQMSKSFFDELQIPEPAFNLSVGSKSASSQIGEMLVKLDEVFEKVKPVVTIVFGDTNSTAAGAIAAAKHQVKLAHVEAGLREFNKAIPEESNKLITDALADFYFCPTDTGVDILKRFGITDFVHNVGDIMIDLNHRFADYINSNIALLERLGITSEEYFFVTCHRASNTNDLARLEEILQAIAELEKPVVFPLHPRTRKIIEATHLAKYLAGGIIITEPLKYLDTQTLIKNAFMVLTDSGGVTKEAYFYKRPGVILDDQTEWIETVREGWNVIAGASKNRILHAVTTWKRPLIHSNCLGDGMASNKIVDILDQSLG